MTTEADRARYHRTLRERCESQPDSFEDHPWGDTVFKIRGKGKIFAFLASEERAGVTVKAPPDEVDALLELPFVKRSAYIGRYGWVSVSVEDEEALRLALELIDDSYELIGAKSGRKRASARSAAEAPPRRP